MSYVGLTMRDVVSAALCRRGDHGGGEREQGITCDHAACENLHGRATLRRIFFLPDKTGSDASQNRPAGKRTGEQKTRGEKNAELSLRPTEKLKQRAGYGPDEQVHCGRAGNTGIHRGNVDLVDRGNLSLGEKVVPAQADDSNGDSKGYQRSEKLLAPTLQL